MEEINQDVEKKNFSTKPIISEELSSKKISLSTKKEDIANKYFKSTITNDKKFATKLPRLQHKKQGRKENAKPLKITLYQPNKEICEASTAKQQKEVPLWRIHSKDFCRKGGVENKRDSKQNRRKPPRKQIRQPFRDRLNSKVKIDAVTTKCDKKDITKKNTPKPLAMSKRNEEQMKKFLERQSVGREDRAKREQVKTYANYVKN